MKRYYVIPKNAVGENAVITGDEIPVDMAGVIVIDLPFDTKFIKVKSKNKIYPDFKVVKALAVGQITIDDLEAA